LENVFSSLFRMASTCVPAGWGKRNPAKSARLRRVSGEMGSGRARVGVMGFRVESDRIYRDPSRGISQTPSSSTGRSEVLVATLPSVPGKQPGLGSDHRLFCHWSVFSRPDREKNLISGAFYLTESNSVSCVRGNLFSTPPPLSKINPAVQKRLHKLTRIT